MYKLWQNDADPIRLNQVWIPLDLQLKSDPFNVILLISGMGMDIGGSTWLYYIYAPAYVVFELVKLYIDVCVHEHAVWSVPAM